MAEISKHMFDENCSNLKCFELLHPWSSSCLQANILNLANSVVGSYKFYAYVYMIQMAMRGKLMTAEEAREMGKQYVMSGILGLVVSSSACTLNCIARNWIFGRFTYYGFLLIPNTLNGLAIYLEPPGRRGLVVNLFVNLVIEYWIRWLERAGVISVTPAKLTFFFMVGSSLLFYLMRLEGDKKKRTHLLWFFTPEKVNHRVTNNNDCKAPASPCPHRGSCWKHILKSAGGMFGAGCAITAARVLLPRLSSPLKAVSSLRPNHLRLALFLGGYIGIYKAVICLLCRKLGKDDARYALPAGFLAGAAFRWHPGLAFSIASITAAMKLYSTVLYSRGVLSERVPLPELLFCLCQGLLYHARYYHPDVCPKYVFNLMGTVSNGCTEQIYAKMLEAVKRAN